MWRRDKFKFPPGPYRGLKGWSFRALRQNPLEMFSELARCGDIVGIRVVNFRNIFVNHPDLIEEVLVGHPRRYIKGRVLRANRHVFGEGDRKSTRLNSSHTVISYAVFCLKKKKKQIQKTTGNTTN